MPQADAASARVAVSVMSSKPGRAAPPRRAARHPVVGSNGLGDNASAVALTGITHSASERQVLDDLAGLGHALAGGYQRGGVGGGRVHDQV